MRDSLLPGNVPPIRRQCGAVGGPWPCGLVPGRAQWYLSPSRFHSLTGQRHIIVEAPPLPWPRACGPDSTTEPLTQAVAQQLLLGYDLLQALSVREKTLLSVPPANAIMKLWSNRNIRRTNSLELRILFFFSKNETCRGKYFLQDISVHHGPI